MPEGSHNGIAAVLKTAGRKPVGVRVPRPPLLSSRVARYSAAETLGSPGPLVHYEIPLRSSSSKFLYEASRRNSSSKFLSAAILLPELLYLFQVIVGDAVHKVVVGVDSGIGWFFLTE
jgi:hypothetical protein